MHVLDVDGRTHPHTTSMPPGARYWFVVLLQCTVPEGRLDSQKAHELRENRPTAEFGIWNYLPVAPTPEPYLNTPDNI